MDGNFHVFSAKVTAVYPESTYAVVGTVKTVIRNAYTIDILPILGGRMGFTNVPMLRPNSGGKGNTGVWFLPEVDDVVICGFIDGMEFAPVCFGSILSTAKQVGPKNAKQKGDYVITHNSGNYIRLRGGAVEVTHTSGAQIKIDASGNLSLTGINKVDVTGKQVNILGSEKINLGAEAVEKIIKGTSFMEYFNSHSHLTGVGPSATPTVQMTENLLSNIAKTV